MEQKRTLWIVLATGFFLLAVVLGVMIFYQPSNTRNTPQQWISTPGKSEIISSNSFSQGYAEPQRSPQEINTETQDSSNIELSTSSSLPTTIDAKDASENPSIASKGTIDAGSSNVTLNAENVNVYSEGTTNIYGTTIDLNSSKSQDISAVTAKNETAKNAAQAKKEEIKAAESVKQAPVVEKTTEKTTVSNSTEKKSSKTSSQKASTSSAKSTAKSKTNASTKSTITNTIKPADSYWVQVAAYTTKKNADEAREILDQAKLPAEVFTYTDSKGTLYYRVRVGPYTTTSEADYWSSKITAIKDFQSADPYVTNTSAPASK